MDKEMLKFIEIRNSYVRPKIGELSINEKALAEYEKFCLDLIKQLEELELQNFNLREDIMIQKMSLPSEKIKDKSFYELYDMPSYEELFDLIKKKQKGKNNR